jgi:hypothetical protein
MFDAPPDPKGAATGALQRTSNALPFSAMIMPIRLPSPRNFFLNFTMSPIFTYNLKSPVVCTKDSIIVPKTKENNLFCVSVDGMSQLGYNTNMSVIFGVHIPLWGWASPYHVTDFHL